MATDAIKKLEELNKKVHKLNYVSLSDVMNSSIPSHKPNAKKSRQLAKKIRKNIEEYRNEIDTPSRHNHQAP